ncbi:cupredoxin domain-containing protein [Amycolatopsis lurida]
MSRVLVVALLLLGGQLLIPASASAASTHVMISGYAYSPATLTVRTGDTVTWSNHDQAPHDVVTTSAPASFKSPMLATGQSWSHTFAKAGSYSYYCSVHPDMKAKVAAQQAAAPPAQPTAPKQPAPATKPSTGTTQAPASPVPTTSAETGETSAIAGPPTVDQAPPANQQALPAEGPSLDPMLLVAGVVTAVAILCLLLLSSRRQD